MRATSRLLRQRNLMLALLLATAVAAWIVLIRDATGMAMPNTPTMGMQAPVFLTVWVTMMVAMMFPTAAPMILTFQRVQSGKRARGEAFVSTWVFVAAYMLVWVATGVLAYAGAAGAEAAAARAKLSPEIAARVGGVLLVFAGIYQLSPLKNVCLAKCRNPLSFVLTSWRDGLSGAVRMGVEHGTFCLGCCWLLFLVLFPLGIMNVAAMAVVTVVVFAEKALTSGRRVASWAGIALIVYGCAVLAVPRALPTYAASTAPLQMDPNMKM